MKLALSKLTQQGQISVPSKVRAHLGVKPGSTLEWSVVGNHVVVRRTNVYSSEEIRRSLFGSAKPKQLSRSEQKKSVRTAVAQKHARR